MTLELLMKHLAEAVKMHLDYLEIDANDIKGGAVIPHEINDDEVTYRLVIKRGKNVVKYDEPNQPVKTDDGTTELKPTASTAINAQPTASQKPRCCSRGKTSELGCEYFDNGICRGICYPTYPPQYDPCMFLKNSK